MAEWRRHAMATFPDRVGSLTTATSLNDLWFSLLQDLQAAYREIPPKTELIERIWSFAAWCFSSERHDTVQNAVAISFYEHLPHFGPAACDLPTRLSLSDFNRLIPAFKTTLTPKELSDLMEAFLTAKGVSKRDIRQAIANAS
jgi:hypothetical protein